MKQRFSSLDVKVIAHELNQSLTSLRVANIYDLSTKILLFKFAKPDTKKQLLIDIGFRCHTTEFARATAGTPSAFVSRLRKTLKTRRLTLVSQIGTDRILEFQFSDGQYRLYLEFFASGNVILTDADLKILALSRNVSEGEGQEPQKVGLQYSLESRQNFLGIPDLSEDRVRTALAAAVEKASTAKVPISKPSSKQTDVLRKCLAVSITELPPILVDHILRVNDFDTSHKLEVILEDASLLKDLTESLRKARELVDSITSSPTCAGFIFAKKPTQEQNLQSQNAASKARLGLLYDDFHPFVPAKFEKNNDIEVLQFDGYNQTVDEFFSSLEGQRLESRLVEREAAAQRKLDAAKQEQENRIKGLQSYQSDNFRKAAAIEANIERVQEAMDSINGLLDQGMDWVDIGKLVEREQKKNNAVANLICLPLNLADNVISVRLSEEDDAESEEEDPFETDDSGSESEDDVDAAKGGRKNSNKTVIVEVVLTLSPWSNAREYYDQRKTAVVKEEKTQLQADRAIKSTEQKIKHDLKKVLKQEKALLQPIRNLMWFEKFYWFISSDGYLVVAAKDKSQAEILYRRHLRSGDVFCHADASNAAVAIVKNSLNTADAPIPPATLAQAGQLSVCSSDAWDSKAGIGAWWVKSNQVSKSTSTGDILQPGNFNISGEKNFLPPGQLVLGLSVMFKISEESKAHHNKHRIQDEPAADAAPERQTSSKFSHVDPKATDDGVERESYTTIASEKSDGEQDEIDHEDDDEQPARSNPLQGQDLGSETPQHDDHGGDDDQVRSTIASLNVNEESDDDVEELDTTQSEANTIETGTETGSVAKSTARGGVPPESKKPKRGQKGKAKKIAAKYKNQDEEDRAAAEVLIGSAAGKQKAEAEAQAKLKREQDMEQAKARRRAQHEKKQKEVAQHEEKRRAILDGVDPEGDDEDELRAPIDLLVGTPRPGDEIVEAITFCAPWAALGRSKYKFKLQPGTVKKGKAVKELLERWRADAGRKGAVDEKSTDTEKMWPREVELIKFLKPEEIVNTVPAGRVRLVVVGANSGSGKGRGSGGGKNQVKGGKKGK
ncbi:serologically defined colon cancer antigen 1 [Akanthomyces lecanii RCEF 1005]|uniref:Ribosome quality control complex subunit 2 n=1 Tax=Akanthomyces lecanii RCEF 1005 TaxID=1081108 RepID=A0A162KID5_CORDF|nr:serologically defined colon cancer antigen 1 [Akanthomyces lecanii RCEF 1005]